MGCFPAGHNKILKKERALRNEIKCGRCPYHKIEDKTRYRPKPEKYQKSQEDHMNKRLQRLNDAYSITVSRGDLHEMARIRQRIVNALILLAA